MKRTSHEYVAIGLLLFALFFGAGNLIFPAFLGQNAGSNTFYATLGFIITGVGLPLASVLAVCRTGKGLRELSSRVSPLYGLFFSCALYLTIGPFFAIPRTATTSFEIAMSPFLPEDLKSMGLYAFVFVFFVISWWLAITPSKLVSRIGKVITPALLSFLFILIVASIVSPMGPQMEPTAAYATPAKAFSAALVEGYNTMDVLAGLVFGVIVLESISLYGNPTPEEATTTALKCGLISTFFLLVIYAALCYLGAASVSVLGHVETGAPVLVGSSDFYFGTMGSLILGVIVILACLTTSIGLIASCAAFFHQLMPQMNHRNWATLFAVVSFLIALFGLSSIIKGAIPVLLFLYPLAVALIILALSDSYFGGAQSVYVGAITFTIFPSLYDAVKVIGIHPAALEPFMSSLPLAEYSMSWLLFFAVGFALGLLWKCFGKSKEAASAN